MDFDQYVAARYGRLIEHAVLMGCAEGEAGTVVDQVLVAQRRQIRRSKDPDPKVRDALEQAIHEEPTRRRHGGPIAAVALVAGLALIGAIITYQPTPGEVTMPSLFGYDGARATTYLRELGLDVQVDRIRGCEPLGQVIGSQPGPGDTVQEGSTVVVHTALPSDASCLPDYDDRVAAWTFIGFALGGPAPSFGDQVSVIDAASAEQADAQASTDDLTGSQAIHTDQWGDVLDTVARASQTRVHSSSRTAILDVDNLVPPDRYCGRLRPDAVGTQDALRVQIDTSGDGDAKCPLTVDLYRDDSGQINTVVLYPAA